MQSYHDGGGCEELCVELGRILCKDKHLVLLKDFERIILKQDHRRFKNEVLLWQLTGAPPTRIRDTDNSEHARVR